MAHTAKIIKKKTKNNGAEFFFLTRNAEKIAPSFNDISRMAVEPNGCACRGHIHNKFYINRKTYNDDRDSYGGGDVCLGYSVYSLCADVLRITYYSMYASTFSGIFSIMWTVLYICVSTWQSINAYAARQNGRSFWVLFFG